MHAVSGNAEEEEAEAEVDIWSQSCADLPKVPRPNKWDHQEKPTLPKD